MLCAESIHDEREARMSMPIHPELRYDFKVDIASASCVCFMCVPPHVSHVSKTRQETVGLVPLRRERLLARAACWMQHIVDDDAAHLR